MHEHHKKKIIGINTTEVAEAQFESMLRIGANISRKHNRGWERN